MSMSRTFWCCWIAVVDGEFIDAAADCETALWSAWRVKGLISNAAVELPEETVSCCSCLLSFFAALKKGTS